MFVDLALEELQQYRPDVAEPADFDDFWASEVSAARAIGGEPVCTMIDSGITHSEVFDVSFPGHGGAPVKAWLLLPHEPLPDAALVVEYIGYGGGRGDPLDWLNWVSAGYPHLVMDSRGQGGGWRHSDTPDPGESGAPSTPGFVTRGIADPRTHYYTRLFVDAVRIIDAAAMLPGCAGRPIVTTGGSQGGALALVAAHLHEQVAVTMPDVPFLAHFRRATQITDSHPYGEIGEYCRVHSDKVEQVFRTLSYLDVVNHAKRCSAAALFSVALIDDIAPASTVFAAFNSYAGPKHIAVYPFNQHEGGGTRHFKAKLTALAEGPTAFEDKERRCQNGI
jgi:cephalosporin-C deacetylase